jgi:hypothetical protein
MPVELLDVAFMLSAAARDLKVARLRPLDVVFRQRKNGLE